MLILQWITPKEVKKFESVSLSFYKLTWTREFFVQILSLDSVLGFSKYYEIRKCLRASVDISLKNQFLKEGSDDEEYVG